MADAVAIASGRQSLLVDEMEEVQIFVLFFFFLNFFFQLEELKTRLAIAKNEANLDKGTLVYYCFGGFFSQPFFYAEKLNEASDLIDDALETIKDGGDVSLSGTIEEARDLIGTTATSGSSEQAAKPAKRDAVSSDAEKASVAGESEQKAKVAGEKEVESTDKQSAVEK